MSGICSLMTRQRHKPQSAAKGKSFGSITCDEGVIA